LKLYLTTIRKQAYNNEGVACFKAVTVIEKKKQTCRPIWNTKYFIS